MVQVGRNHTTHSCLMLANGNFFNRLLCLSSYPISWLDDRDLDCRPLFMLQTLKICNEDYYIYKFDQYKAQIIQHQRRERITHKLVCE